MGCLCIAALFFAGSLALFLVGLLLITCGILEMLETFQVSNDDRRHATYLSGVLSIVAGVLLLAQPQLVLSGLALFVAGSFLIDGVGKLAAALRSRAAAGSWTRLFGVGLVNVVLGLMLVIRWPVAGLNVVIIVVGIRMLATGWSILRGREDEPAPAAEPPPETRHPDGRLGLPPHQEFGTLQASLKAEEAGRRRIDAAWCWTFVIVFFAIHIGRMNVAWNLVGMVSPLVAVVGDVGTALLIAFALILPCRLAWRKWTRPVERRG
jgi:uncharacterized membrane protein HdeD (DUF308 family)